MDLFGKGEVLRQGPVSDPRARTLNTGITLFVVVLSAVLFSTPLRHDFLLPYAQDDLYYYLIVARNLARGVGSTFDGTTLTNGYHPLYLLFLWAVTKIDPGLRAIYRALWLLDVASAAITLIAVRTLFARRFSNAWFTNGFAVAIVYLCCWRLIQQMEVTLALPLGFVLLVLIDHPPQRLTASRWALIGFTAALLTLSRLDAGVLVALCTVAALLSRSYRSTLTWQKLAAFAGSYLPLPLLYFSINEHIFHRLMPISGSAKQTSTAHRLYLEALLHSFSTQAALMFLLALLALCSLPYFWRRLSSELRVISISVLLFPFVHWGINAFLSDWMLFPWYRYSLIFAMSIVLLLIGIAIEDWASPRSLVLLGIGTLVTSVAALASVRYKPDQVMVDLAAEAEYVQAFAAAHPGRYAIGDRAGMVGYTDGQPTIQLEGLMMDDVFLNHVRRSEPLRDALRDYRIDYYIAFDWVKAKDWPQKGCFQAKEPQQGGPYSPAMRAEFCEAPVAEFMRATGRTLIFNVGSGMR